MNNQKRAVFLDRDGVVNRAVPREGFELPTSPFSLKEFEIFSWVPEALALLKEMNFLRILVSNQPDVRKGFVTQEEWQAMQDKVEELGFDRVFICPHLTEDRCDCKKPKPGMLLDAAKIFDLDLPRCYMIGDTLADTGAARRAGCKSILIRAPYNLGVKGDYVCKNLLDAVHLIQKLERRIE